MEITTQEPNLKLFYADKTNSADRSTIMVDLVYWRLKWHCQNYTVSCCLVKDHSIWQDYAFVVTNKGKSSKYSTQGNLATRKFVL